MTNCRKYIITIAECWHQWKRHHCAQRSSAKGPRCFSKIGNDNRREAALTRTAKSLCAGPTTSSNLDSHMGRRKSCCVPAVLRRTTHPCARNKFFKHSYNFLWALPSWKSLAPVHKMMGKITRKNIINICSSYRPCPVRRNIEKSTFGQGVQTDRRPLGSPTVLPRCSLGSRQAFVSRFWPDPGSNSFFGPTGCSKRRKTACIVIDRRESRVRSHPKPLIFSVFETTLDQVQEQY